MLLVSLGACTAWTPVPGTELAPQVAESGVIRVTRDDATRVVIHRPHVEGDSVLGWSGRVAETAPQPVSVPANRIVRVERRHFSPARTAGAVLGAGVVATAALVVLILATFSAQ
ncbi:MAG TPA: hypothetical protein VFH27_01055 [Longimicrobiaceae bacterium]|nr:hypothetical protein [Longimicrobiaceae bacterium]